MRAFGAVSKYVLTILLPGFLLLSITGTAAQSPGADKNPGQEVSRPDEWQRETLDVLGARVVDVHGQIHRLGVSRGIVPFVVVFIDRHCPISARYAPELNRISELAATAGGQFFAVLSSPLTNATQARKYVSEAGFQFPVLWDPSGDLAGRLEPAVTPEVFVVSTSGSLIYRGRIDDRFPALGVLRNAITSHDLIDLLTALGRGEKVAPRYEPSVGCFFESWSDALPENVTFTRDIAPIVNANCVECHRQEGVAPFSFESYELTRYRARMMAHVTFHRIMPPWRAEKGYGEFRDERFLSQRQIDLINAWAEAGAPRGQDDESLPTPVWPAPRWQLGEPDLVVEMNREFSIPASGDDIYRYFVMPMELVGDRVIVATEFRPGNPKVVHHSLAYVDYTGRARRQEAKDDEYGIAFFGNRGILDSAHYVYGWTPGLDPLNLPPDHGIPLRGDGSGDIVFEIHYRPNGIATTDRSRMGFYFADKPVSHITTGFVAGTVDVDIAPDDANYWRQVYTEIPADIRLIAVSPHMHYLGKEVKAVATLPDGTEVPLLYIPDWDFRWQNLYIYREPLALPAGTRIDAWFRFDNSSANPYNPHTPPVRTRWGWSSDEEMCEFWMRFVADDNEGRAQVLRASDQSWSRHAKLERTPPDWSVE